jgi:ketosteroid isomerase-like protein
MEDQPMSRGAPPPHVEALLREAYAAFNERDVDRALAAMAPDVAWPNGWEGGHVHGHDEVRAYWTRQWAEIDPQVTPSKVSSTDDGRVAVTVDQQVRGPDGSLISANQVQHVYTFRDGQVARMDIVDPAPSDEH